MIRAVGRGGKPERAVVFLGITHENMARLSAGEPIHVRCSDPPAKNGLGLDGAPDVVIFAGRDEDTMWAELRKSGLITDRTETHDTRPPS